MAPVIDGECKVYDGTKWYVGGQEHGGACEFKIRASIELPDSGDLVGEAAISNVDPDQKYYLHTAIFDECAPDTRRLVKKGFPVQTGTGVDPQVCCYANENYAYRTLSSCLSADGTDVNSALCESSKYTKICYKCTAEGTHTHQTFVDTSKITCGSGIALGYPYDEEQEAYDECYITPPAQDTITCYKCIDTDPYFQYIEFLAGTTCGSGEAVEYDKDDPADCPKVQDEDLPTTCCKCSEGAEDNKKCLKTLPPNTECATVNEYDLTEAQAIAQCTTDVADYGDVYENPEDETEWCVKGFILDKCYPKKDNIFLDDLGDLEQLSVWEKTSLGYLEDETVPICLNEWGDLQCKEGGECLPAKNSEREMYEENKIVYDTLDEVMTTNADKFGNVVETLSTLGLNKLFTWLVDWSPQESEIEKWGVCVYEDRGLVDQFKSWLAELLGFDTDDPTITYIMIGIALGAIALIYFLLQPPKPRRA